MTALLILNYDVTDAAGLATYREHAGPLLAASGTRVVTTGQTHDLGETAGPSGSQAAGTHTVIWRFPDVATAREVYDSPAYRTLAADRMACTTTLFAVIAEEVVP